MVMEKYVIKIMFLKKKEGTSSQDGGIGRHAVPT